VVVMIVMAFTSPWDNWAVKKGIWDFPPKRIWFRIGYLPIEEYIFFVWQTLNVILSVRWFMLTFPSWRTGILTPVGPVQGGLLLIIIIIWVSKGLRMDWRPVSERNWYAWHLLFWFVPVIFLQWAIAGLLFWHYAPVLLGATLWWGTYYTLADWVAVRQKVWYFDRRKINSWRLAKVLPWEEIAFFYLTSLLVAQSYLMLLPSSLR
jgi:lycopene beta-cyclase